jgi:NADH-quinone oxidoreductase subunit N
MNLLDVMWPELIVIGTACVLFLLGVLPMPGARRASAALALISLLGTFVLLVCFSIFRWPQDVLSDSSNSIRIWYFAHYIKMLATGIGVLFVLMSWPTNRDATGNSALDFGHDGGEFFGLLLLSIAGVMLVASANDIILLFLGIELAAIPTYIMVSISRPLPVAQEAGVKYFFLGAMAAAVMLFGFSYLYGTTGTTKLSEILQQFSDRRTAAGSIAALPLGTWQMLAVIMLICGFAFKLAAVPLHFYAGDVYQGAATPVTALLSFVPKASGLVALIKILYVVGGGMWILPAPIGKLLWIIAVLTMSVGNVLGLLQNNVKRTLAYSSIAHSGYLLTGVAVMAAPFSGFGKQDALQAVLFYLAAYGIMNAGAFGVLMMLPSRHPKAATSAETFDDLAGQGRNHVGLGLAMTVCCFSLIGLPLTVGFFGKLFLIRAQLRGEMYWLVIITVINAAISAAYYLRIVGSMFLRTTSEVRPHVVTPALAEPTAPAEASFPLVIAVGLSVAGTLVLGIIPPLTETVLTASQTASSLERTAVPLSTQASASAR